MSTVALSLFLFNLLPLPYTDGSHLLKAVMSLQTSRQATFSLRSSVSPNRPLTARPSRSATTPTINIRLMPDRTANYAQDSDDELDGRYDTEGGGRGDDRREEAWKRRLRRTIEGGTMGMAAAWVIGWAMLALLRSS